MRDFQRTVCLCHGWYSNRVFNVNVSKARLEYQPWRNGTATSGLSMRLVIARVVVRGATLTPAS
jgi:hypothetical protein